jgi:hypothetical protein
VVHQSSRQVGDRLVIGRHEIDHGWIDEERFEIRGS